MKLSLLEVKEDGILYDMNLEIRGVSYEYLRALWFGINEEDSDENLFFVFKELY